MTLKAGEHRPGTLAIVPHELCSTKRYLEMSGAELNDRLDGINRRLQVIEMLAERINIGVDVPPLSGVASSLSG
jgi:hypothetical protein